MSDAEEFLEKLDKDDLDRLERLLATLRMVDGWCKVSRWIGKWIIVSGLTLLVLLSGAVEALQKLIGWKH